MLTLLLRLAAITVTVSCMSSVKVKPDLKFGERPPHCFRADFKDRNGIVTYSWNCYTTRSMCSAALKVAKKYGSMADVKALTKCKRV